MQESTPPSLRYGLSSRGISGRDVELAADALLRAGERPTIEKIREKIGRGSPNTVNPLLDAWWKRLAARLDAGPAALHRLPESVARVAEALWMQALDEGRRRAEHETHRRLRDTVRTQEDLEVRSHVLSLREGELDSRLKERERDIEELRLQLQTLSLTARKDHATIDAQATRIATLEDQLLARPRPPTRPRSRPKLQPTLKTSQKLKRAGRLLRPSAAKLPNALKRKTRTVIRVARRQER